MNGEPPPHAENAMRNIYFELALKSSEMLPSNFNIHINYDPNIDYNPHAITTYIKKKLLHFYKGKPNKKSLSYIILKEKNNKNIRLTIDATT